ncbi:putative choline dehydrogenase [Tricharina praecox]|uniref:putative choline dehydrogenase n=1 Tax=Tricharina praecox TaxID=43433 RepID=UPI0022205D3A|nr:putative choline dehydrogenase [Tricharina praecox]KAI5848104.1 putative choline dehydrogenase [Tricharina praecox]
MLLSSLQPLLFLARSYDYIIVGGGTAGLTLAGRLCSDPSVTVGVLEAGPDAHNDPLVYIPGFYGYPQRSSGYGPDDSPLDWGFRTEPQPHVDNRRMPWSRGKMLGGSSALNYMIWDVPSAPEYDAYATHGNAPGWNWCTVSAAVNKAWRAIQPGVLTGQAGELSVQKFVTPGTELFAPTLKKLGVKVNPNPLSGDAIGTYDSPASILNGASTRSYSVSAYLLPNAHRDNLVVLPGATGARVVLDASNRAIGMEFLDCSGRNHTAFLNPDGEVVLSAGSTQTPQLLELSGIGKKSVLDAVGIPVRVRNDNVGEDLQDHLFAPLVYEITPGIPTRDLLLTSLPFLATAEANYTNHRDGILSSGISALSFVPLTNVMDPPALSRLIAETKLSKPSVDPFSTFTLPYSPQHRDANKVAQLEFLFGNYKVTPGPREVGKSYISIWACLLHPLSRGSIHISSRDPLVPPVIDPQYYSEAVDRAVMLAGVKFADKIANTAPLSGIIKRRVDLPPGRLTDQQLWAYTKKVTQSIWHPVASAAMGKVVDDRLRVFGVKGLRVVDASIAPLLISAHSQATVYGIAELAAEIMKEDRRRKTCF